MIRFKHSVEDSFGFFHFIVVFYGFFVKVKKPGFFSGENFRECCFVWFFLSFDGKPRRILKVPVWSRAGRPH